MENACQQHSSHRQEMDQLEAEYSRVLSEKEDYERQQNKKSKEHGRTLELEESQVSSNAMHTYVISTAMAISVLCSWLSITG